MKLLVRNRDFKEIEIELDYKQNRIQIIYIPMFKMNFQS